MRRTLPFALLFVAITLSAQNGQRAIPLTNTGYGTAGARPYLRSNGQDVILISRGKDAVRAVKIVDGQNRAGDVVFETPFEFDAAWMGTRFLAVSSVSQAGTTQYPHNPSAVWNRTGWSVSYGVLRPSREVRAVHLDETCSAS